MSRHIDALQQARSEIKRVYGFAGAALVVALLALWGWKDASREVLVHIPPDLRSGAELRAGDTPEVPDTTVYTFGFYIWQQLNRWAVDGNKDYGEQIYALQHYVTPACREQLVADMNQRSRDGELVQRTRAVMEIPGLGYSADRVKLLGNNTWQVLLDTQVQETQLGQSIKNTYIRYPLRVVRFDIHRDLNPWRLAIDCFGSERPARLDAKAVEVARSGRSVVGVRSTASPAVPVASGYRAPGSKGDAAAMGALAASGGVSTPSAVGIEPVTLPKPLN